MDAKRLGILAGLVFVGLFVTSGVFSLASYFGQAPGTPGALLLTAVEVVAVVWAYEKLAHKQV